MVWWHHWLHGLGFGWAPGVGDGQGGLVCCDSWGRKESDTTEWLNWTELNWTSGGRYLSRGSWIDRNSTMADVRKSTHVVEDWVSSITPMELTRERKWHKAPRETSLLGQHCLRNVADRSQSHPHTQVSRLLEIQFCSQLLYTQQEHQGPEKARWGAGWGERSLCGLLAVLVTASISLSWS